MVACRNYIASMLVGGLRNKRNTYSLQYCNCNDATTNVKHARPPKKKLQFYISNLYSTGIFNTAFVPATLPLLSIISSKVFMLGRALFLLNILLIILLM